MVLAPLIVMFRETLEASLIISIMLSHLNKIGQKQYSKLIWLGTGAGIIVSLLAGLLFYSLSVKFEGTTEQIFEGIAMVLASVLIGYMVMWMLKQRNYFRKNIENKIDISIKNKQKKELFFLPFIAVLREGIESVIFLSAIFFVSEDLVGSIAGSVIGFVLAAGIGYLIFVMAKKINLKPFLTGSSIFLILLGAGLIAHGVHEFQEAGVIPFVVEEVYSINSILPDGEVPGSILRSAIGYQANPSLLEIIVYVAYLATFVILWKKISSKHNLSKKTH